MKVRQWLLNIILTLNAQITELMVFLREQTRPNIPTGISIDYKPQRCVKTTKFSGLYLDENLSWTYISYKT